jgi:hypothetical protein
LELPVQTALTSRGLPASLGSATLSGRIVGGCGAPRIRVCGPAVIAVPLVLGDRWECSGLPPGRYRVELVDDRTVLAREVELLASREHFVDFCVRAR